MSVRVGSAHNLLVRLGVGMSGKKTTDEVLTNCLGTCIGKLLIATPLGMWGIWYIGLAVFGKHLPWYACLIAGFFLGWITFPLGLISWILTLCGVHTPFLH